MQRTLRTTYWALPPVVCLLLYRNGLTAWFQHDDFAWLGLHLQIVDFRSFLRALFEPMAQGSIRPLSERLFFIAFFPLFGMEALPYRIFVFLTQFGVLALMTATVRRLTGSGMAALLAPLLWLCNSSLAIPLTWTAAYNQILCAFFLLLALYFFIRFSETGDRRYYAIQWAAFILGFGALELNVVYPALALLYAWCRAPRFIKYALPMLGASAVYALVHRWAAANPDVETYRMYFDSSLPGTLWTYVRWVLGSERIAPSHLLSVWPFWAAELLAGTGLAAFAAVKLRRGDRLPLFFLGWFFCVLGPLLPLKNHVSEYYLAIPAIGLSMLGGWAIAEAWKSRIWIPAAAACALAYAAPSAWAAYHDIQFNYLGSIRARSFLRSIAYVHQRHPEKIIILKGVDNRLFWAGFYGNPFRLFGRKQSIYLTEETESRIIPLPDTGPLSRHFLPEAAALEALESGSAVVYEVVDRRLRNITELYHRLLSVNGVRPPSRVDPGQEFFDKHLGKGWHQPENNFRWMGKRGEVYLRGPKGGEVLEVSGLCPRQHVAEGPLHLTTAVNGEPLRTDLIDGGNLSFTFRFKVPPSSVNRPRMTVTLEVDRTLSVPKDRRELGLIFGAIQLTK